MDDLSALDAAMRKHAEEFANAEPVKRERFDDPNCLSHWFPKIEAAGLPVPKTTIVRTDLNLIRIEEGLCDTPEFTAFADEVRAACDSFGYPCFLRTGQGSGKHDWSDCCFVAEREKIARHICQLVVWSHCVDLLGLATDVWAIRELLPTRPLFRCTRYGGFPVVREYRFFVDGERVAYWQPYWPWDALEQGNPDNPNWKMHLPALNLEPPQECFDLASRAGDACGGRWSVDILDTKHGWFVTDMAIAEMSWGFDESRFAATDNFQ